MAIAHEDILQRDLVKKKLATHQGFQEKSKPRTGKTQTEERKKEHRGRFVHKSSASAFLHIELFYSRYLKPVYVPVNAAVNVPIPMLRRSYSTLYLMFCIN